MGPFNTSNNPYELRSPGGTNILRYNIIMDFNGKKTTRLEYLMYALT